MAANTGGTAAPSPQTIRQSGAAQALGAPKGGGRPQGQGKPGGRPPAQKAKPAARPPNAGRPGFQPRPPGQRTQAAKAPAPRYSGKNIFNPAAGIQGSPQLEALADRITKGQLQNQLEPLRQQAGEIRNTQQTVGERYGNAAKLTEGTLQGLQGQQEAGAKTFENNAAEATLQASKGIETAGQNATSRTGGYLDPQVQAALNAQGARAVGLGAAQGGLAANLGQNEANYMTNVRAAAAQRSLEGQGNIAQHYGAELGKVSASERQAIAKQPVAAKSLGVELGQKQFSDLATAQGLGIKTQTLQQKGAETTQRVKATERGQSLAVQRNQENNATRRANASLSAELNRIGKATAQMSAEDKARYDQAQIRVKEAAAKGKPASQKEGRGYMAKLSTAEAIARSVMGKELKTAAAQTKAREELAKKGASGDVISAALNLAVYGRLGPSDEAAAISYGLTKALRPQWFR